MMADALHAASLLLVGASFEIDGQIVPVRHGPWHRQEQRRLPHGVTRWVDVASLASMPDVKIEFTAECADATDAIEAPIRFRYRLFSDKPRRLTRTTGRERITYLGMAIGATARVQEIRLGDFLELTHTYTPATADATPRLRDGLGVTGPIVVVHRKIFDVEHHHLLAYEHGSQANDPFVEFAMNEGFLVVRSVKGNHLDRQPLNVGDGFESPWFHLAAPYDPAGYRRFIKDHQSPNLQSRKPYIFYNTWNYQERIQGWHGKKYLDEMNQDRMSREVEVAAKLGIDVFVIDTGWYQRTGDWQVNTACFPDGLKSLKKQLDSHGMRLGLWFDNAAAMSSRMLAAHRQCVQRVGPEEPKPYPIWETEESLRLCPVSRWWSAFADEMVRLNREVGVTYFKLDAISQGHVGRYHCDADTHDHGDASHTPAERGERFAYLMPIYMAKIAERVRESVPEAIVDFDMTENGRCFGLSFLSASKFFLINNGPYYWNYNVPNPPGYNSNLFFYPSAMRNALCRTTLAFDRILPATALLTHYFPDGTPEQQLDSAISLMLGHGGIWGDLCGLSADDVNRIGKWIALFKQVRDDVADAYPVQSGVPSGTPEVHEKIATSGRGLIAIFAQAPGRYEYVTSNMVDARAIAMEGITIERRSDGRAKITATFAAGQTARVAIFGASEG